MEFNSFLVTQLFILNVAFLDKSTMLFKTIPHSVIIARI